MRFLWYALVTLLAAALSPAQNISSTIKGTLQDQTGGVIPSAVCTLTNRATSAVRQVTSAPDGSFVFLDVLAGNYDLTVRATGFKELRLANITVTASEFHPLGSLSLEVGQATESIAVVEKAEPVQTSSGERSDLVTGSQLSDIAVKGRDFVSYLATMPGIVDTAAATRDSFTRNALSGVHINGGRDTQTLMLIDGMPSLDAGNNGTPEEPNMDSIAEVKILTSNYQAEFGRNGGGVVAVISKSGGRQFHGSAYDYYRDEELNANGFFENRTGTARQPYRYRMTGYSIGGPVLIPKVNAIRNKLFFFFSNEFVGSLVDYNTQFVNTPSAAERLGDFSQSRDVNGALIPIKDPLTGSPFPGNMIPKDRINGLGQSILNFYPLPNYTDPDPNNRYRRNYRSVYSGGWPRSQELGRLDANLWPSFQVFYRVVNDADSRSTPWGSWVDGNINYLLSPIVWDRPGRTHTVHATKTFSSTLVNEVLAGKSYNGVFISPVNPSLLQRSAMGNPPQLFPDATPSANWIPGVQFGGTPISAIDSRIAAQLPEGIINDAYVVSDNLGKVWRSHQIKVGVYGEHNRKVQPSSANYRGTFNFARDANNPFDSGDGFSNALLGNFDTYSEQTSWPIGDYKFWDIEWYAQDNWRVTKRLTFDLGLRFYHMPATVDAAHTVATMDPSLYQTANAPALYRPAKNPAGQRVAVDPAGNFAPAAQIGLFVPNTGNPADGSRVGGVNGYPGGLYTTPWLSFGPRFGFAYDVFGNGKTAIRGGFGMFKDRVQGNIIYNTSANPPVTNSPTLYYGNLNTFTQSAGVIGPSNITELFGSDPLPNIMNFSFGVQQQIGATIADVSYVGMLSRHLPLATNINPIPMFARFQPQNHDPTQPANPLPDNFLRPYIGYGNITDYQFMGTSNYNALQVSIRRRISRNLQFGGSYTFSKALGATSTDTEAVSAYFSPRQRNYGPLTFDRRQALVVNYIYDLPHAGSRLGWRPAKWALDNWELSGITTFQTGSPFTPGFTTTDAQDITGSTDGARINVIGDPNVSSRMFARTFNTAAFGRPAVGTFGTAGTDILYGPGINNWDLAVSKRFPVFSESRSLQFRVEMFNTWNHTQFSGQFATARFDPAGNQVDPNFGAYSAARPPRNIQLSARFVF